MRQLVVAGCALLAAAVWTTSSRQGEAGAQTSAVVLKPTSPVDLPPGPTHADAVAFAWQAFVALNWPVLAGSRGVPDLAKTIGQPGDVVWHTWKAPDEIFYADGRTPPPWNQYGGELPPECTTGGAAPAEFVVRRVAKVPGDTSNDAIERAREAVGGTLTDQHGNLARFEIRMNRTIYDAIVAGAYYNREGQDLAKFISFPPGVMEVKAAWRQMTTADSSAVKSRFYREKAWIYTPPFGSNPASCVQGEVGLVGLHIAHKTPSRPQWTWATFEHVDNVPPGASGWTGPFSFNNPACRPDVCPPNRSTEKNGVPTKVPTQVTRVVAIGKAAGDANPRWQQALRAAVPDSPFAYYQLVDIQWPQSPAQRPFGDPTPGLVANTTMETYATESSCLHCHFTARTASGTLSSDYSFMLGEAASLRGRSGR